MPKRIVAHIDMDAFFASLEERENPHWKGLPIVVGADPKEGRGRGVVSTANYAARVYGIHSALPIRTAWKLAQAGEKKGGKRTVFTDPNFSLYSRVSREVMDIIRAHASFVEVASIDEAYADLSDLESFARAKKEAEHLKEEIFKKERVTASVGIGPNKLIAKIASDRQKPDGLTVVNEQEVNDFLAPLSVRSIPGVGPKAESWFLKQGIRTIREAWQLPEDTLSAHFGVFGATLYERLRGKDDRPLEEPQEAKSIGHQETFEEDVRDPGVVLGTLERMAEKIATDVKKDGFTGFFRIVVTIRFADFETKTTSKTEKAMLKNANELIIRTTQLILPFLDSRKNPKKKAIRLVGLRVEKLV